MAKRAKNDPFRKFGFLNRASIHSKWVSFDAELRDKFFGTSRLFVTGRVAELSVKNCRPNDF